MFERYTEATRRVVFFARFEASEAGSDYIWTEHLLLGMLREDGELAERFQAAEGGVEAVRKQIEMAAPPGPKAPASVDLPLSKGCRRALKYAEAAADKMGQQEIGIGHLALGILSESECLAAEILRERGLG